MSIGKYALYIVLVILCMFTTYLLVVLLWATIAHKFISDVYTSGNVVVTGVWLGYFIGCYIVSLFAKLEDKYAEF